ncbi:MAG: dephospho-CoA kinase [Colwellia sp.]|nr:dephospho-CoA kinase [Colwellia sp.]
MNKSHKVVIGLTGGIGSGKSTITAMFADLGIDIVDADIVARMVVMPKSEALKQISQHFGAQFIQSDGHLNRASLRSRIFSNEQDKTWLNNLLHPLIRQRMIKEIDQSTSSYCLFVAPLLIENNLQGIVNRIIVIDITEKEQIERTFLRDPSSRDEVRRIIASQISRTERLHHADDIIDNNKTDLAEVNKQVIILDQSYRKLAMK